ncbi:hypothetical protein V8C34DRAFT_313505 [Trichoderma compactum]
MPCLRGIELSLIIQPDSVLLPEFPHPDASSVHVASVVEASQKVQEDDVISPGLDSPRIQKTAPRASVYVPSAPGSQFWVQYSIHRHPEPPCYLFFKLFMNGRNITSCGIKPGTASGTITRALFEPSDRWHLKQDGMLLKRSGIESRSFCFCPGPDAIAAADDGGLIEVQVFRAKSRRRSTPQLTVHRDQERYGIISPSTGLLEHPEDAMYYEWILQDATEAPFATFCFHYRAWTYLCDLNLVTDNDNSLLYNAKLWGRFESSRHEATGYAELEGESTTSNAALDLGYLDNDEMGAIAPCPGYSKMADSGWMRLLPGQRCRTPVSPLTPYDPAGIEDTFEAHHLRIAPRPLAGFYHSSADSGNDILIKEADRLQNTPSVDEMADVLRTTIMVSSTPPTLGPQYTSYVLHLIEGYSKLRTKLSKKEKEVVQLEATRQEDKERSKALVSDWAAQEARYKAEIKRLELIIQKVSRKGVEAVALARSGSLIRRGGHMAEANGFEMADSGESRFGEYDLESPCLQGKGGQGRRTSSSSDTVDLAARLNTKRQLWRHRSENNLLEPSRKGRIGRGEHRHGQLLIHLTLPQRPFAPDTAKLEPDEGGGASCEERLIKSTTADAEETALQ